MKAESEGLQHLGFFHSHQLNAKPSAMDLKYMRLWPEKIWLIISALNSKIAAYRVIDDKLHEVYITIE
jgi:proteasome lid subunit RPN8/RPN11